MPQNNQKEYIDIPLNIEETPSHLAEKLTTYNFPENHMDIGLDFITRLEAAIKGTGNQQDLYSLYVNYYEIVNASKFGEKDWPATHEIEAHIALVQEKDFGSKLQNVYNEVTNRSKFERLRQGEDQSKFLDIAETTWETYESIFQRQFKEINFPPTIVWEIVQNFLYQFVQYHYFLETSKSKERVDPSVFNIDSSKALLNKLIEGIPAVQNKSATSRELFGYYALVVRAQMQIYFGHYQQALDVLSRVSLEDTLIYSSSLGSLLNLFFAGSYSYFMLQRYKESARLAEMFLVFYQKNKKYFGGISSEKIINKQIERLAALLCINYVFLEEKPKNLIMEVFKNITIKVKDKQQRQKLSDKYLKLRQNDQGTFTRLFNHSFLAIIGLEQKSQYEKMLERFKKLKAITLNTILQHYTQIQLSKVAQLLAVSEKEVRERLQSWGNIAGSQSKWDTTIMQPLLSQTRKVEVEIVENVVRIDTEEQAEFSEWQQSKKEISWLVEKVNRM